MDFKFKIKVGSTEIEITESADNHKQFIEKLQFFTSLPTKGPKGAEDLKFVARKTSKGDTYYSLISEQDKAEFKLGQHKNKEETLYGKGWFDLFGTDADENGNYPEEQQQAPVQTAPQVAKAAPVINKPNIPTINKPNIVKQPQAAVSPTAEQVQEAVAQEQAPVEEAKPAVTQIPKPATSVLSGIKRPIIPGAVKTPVASAPAQTSSAPAQAAPVTTAPTTAPGKPVVSSSVNSVLAKYGINKG